MRSPSRVASPNIGAAYITPDKTITTQSEQQHLHSVLDQPEANAHFTGWSYVMADLGGPSNGFHANFGLRIVQTNLDIHNGQPDQFSDTPGVVWKNWYVLPSGSGRPLQA